MSIIRFIFPFLYTRNWYSGAHELSYPRVLLFAGMIFLVLIAVAIALFLQAPVTYNA